MKTLYDYVGFMLLVTAITIDWAIACACGARLAWPMKGVSR